MKDARDWDEEYVLNLPPGEQDWFEAKSSGALDPTLPNAQLPDRMRDELSVSLSALANTGGGVLVYGISEVDEQWQVDSGGVSLNVKKRNTKEWLEDII